MNKNTFITTAGSENPSTRKKVCVQVTLIFLYKCCKRQKKLFSQYIELYSEISILKL